MDTTAKKGFCTSKICILLIATLSLILLIYYNNTTGDITGNFHGNLFTQYNKYFHSFNKSNFILSYSIFGEDCQENWGELIGVVASEVRRSSLYASWSIRIYHDGKLQKNYMNSYTQNYSNLHFFDVRHIINVGDLSAINAMTWRFLPLLDPSARISCFRDLDSPILKREEHAVTEWLYSNKLVHVMRDHEEHLTAILGGLWCFKNYKDQQLAAKIMHLILENSESRNEKRESKRGNDQWVLQTFIWPLVKEKTLQHDSYLCKYFKSTNPFPTKRRSKYKFIGCQRPCDEEITPCPIQCRPRLHHDWIHC